MVQELRVGYGDLRLPGTGCRGSLPSAQNSARVKSRFNELTHCTLNCSESVSNPIFNASAFAAFRYWLLARRETDLMAAATNRSIFLAHGNQHTISKFIDADALALGFEPSGVVLRRASGWDTASDHPAGKNFEDSLAETWVEWVFGDIGLGPRIRDMWVAVNPTQYPNLSSYTTAAERGELVCDVRLVLDRFDVSASEAFTRYPDTTFPGVEEQILDLVVQAANKVQFSLHDTKGPNILLTRERSGWKVRLLDVSRSDLYPEVPAACRELFALGKVQAQLGCETERGMPLIAERVESLAKENPVCARTLFKYSGSQDNSAWLAGPLELRNLILNQPCLVRGLKWHQCVLQRGVLRFIGIREACSMRPIGSNISASHHRLCAWG